MILHSSNSIKLNVRTIRNLKTHNWRKLLLPERELQLMIQRERIRGK
jgi:hypothetical protein